MKCPFKHRKSKIAEACVDSVDDGFRLKRTHDYYYQVTGQLALSGSQFCDFVVWTEVDIHIKRIHLDRESWEDMLKKLTDFYHTCLELETLERLFDM